MRTQAEKAAPFAPSTSATAQVHHSQSLGPRYGPAARALGFEALATTSLGVAKRPAAAGAPRSELLANSCGICDATELPVNADLENGFADDPATRGGGDPPGRRGRRRRRLDRGRGAGDRADPIYDFAPRGRAHPRRGGSRARAAFPFRR